MRSKTILNQRISEIAAMRTELHRSHTSTRVLTPDYEYIGVAGEIAFATEFGLEVDTTARLGGDGGVDFATVAGTIDVKTFRRPFNLLREVGREEAEILVLAGFSDATGTASLIGWEYDTVMTQCPTRDFGYGILSYYKPAEELHHIWELDELIATP